MFSKTLSAFIFRSDENWEKKNFLRGFNFVIKKIKNGKEDIFAGTNFGDFGLQSQN